LRACEFFLYPFRAVHPPKNIVRSFEDTVYSNILTYIAHFHRRASVQGLYATDAFLVLTLFFVTGLTDPVDKNVSKRKNSDLCIDVPEMKSCFSPANRISTKHDEVAPKFWCNSCDSIVDTGSKHCRECNKCVANFDHHCKWLNNCVGSKNYFSFFGLLVAVALQLIMQLVTCAYLLARYASKESSDDASSPAVGSIQGSQVYFASLCIAMIICVAVLLVVGELLLFHLLLILRGKTTYEYIVLERARLSLQTSTPNSWPRCKCARYGWSNQAHGNRTSPNMAVNISVCTLVRQSAREPS